MKHKTAMLAFLIVTAVFPCCIRNHPGFPGNTKLFLVGVGPCGPDLCSVRAVNIIRAADIIVCYPWVNEKMKGLIAGKETIIPEYGLNFFYGNVTNEMKKKWPGKFEETLMRRNEFINCLRRILSSGKTIAVLDSGDPMLFSPWTWLLEEFAGEHPEVVPGISSFNAAHAAIKKSPNVNTDTNAVILTVYDRDDSFHQKKDSIAKLSRHQASMALFTMKKDFNPFIDELKKGYTADTPVAVVISAGCSDSEHVVTGTLENIKNKIKNIHLPEGDYLIYVGNFISYSLKDKK